MSLDAQTIALEEVQRQTRESPTQELLRRYADHSPEWLLPRLYATQHLGQQWEDARARLIDDHICELRAKGADDLAAKWLEVKPDMGAISIQGDTFVLPAAPQQQAAAAATPTTSTSSKTEIVKNFTRNGLRSFVVPVLLGAASLGAGAAGMALYNYFTDKPDSVTTITQPGGKFEYRYGIEQRPTPSQ